MVNYKNFSTHYPYEDRVHDCCFVTEQTLQGQKTMSTKQSHSLTLINYLTSTSSKRPTPPKIQNIYGGRSGEERYSIPMVNLMPEE